MGDKHDHECGCGGMCKWSDKSPEDKIAHLEKKEAKLKRMLAHIEKVKEAVKSGKPMADESDDE